MELNKLVARQIEFFQPRNCTKGFEESVRVHEGGMRREIVRTQVQLFKAEEESHVSRECADVV